MSDRKHAITVNKEVVLETAHRDEAEGKFWELVNDPNAPPRDILWTETRVLGGAAAGTRILTRPRRKRSTTTAKKAPTKPHKN